MTGSVACEDGMYMDDCATLVCTVEDNGGRAVMYVGSPCYNIKHHTHTSEDDVHMSLPVCTSIAFQIRGREPQSGRGSAERVAEALASSENAGHGKVAEEDRVEEEETPQSNLVAAVLRSSFSSWPAQRRRYPWQGCLLIVIAQGV